MGPAQAKLARVVQELGGSARWDDVLAAMYRKGNVSRSKQTLINLARRANRLHNAGFRWNELGITLV